MPTLVPCLTRDLPKSDRGGDGRLQVGFRSGRSASAEKPDNSRSRELLLSARPEILSCPEQRTNQSRQEGIPDGAWKKGFQTLLAEG